MSVSESEPEAETLEVVWPGRTLRLFEIVLVLSIAFGGNLLLSFSAVTTGASVQPEASGGGSVRMLYGILEQITSLALLVYVLYRRGCGLADIGLSFSWKDVARSVGLALAAMLAYWVWGAVVYSVCGRIGVHFPSGGPQNIGFLLASPSWWTTFCLLFYVIINPFKEELIVRAFLKSEVRWLSGRAPVAVLVSVIVQCSYHLYQGVYYALSYIALFLVFSLYYVRTGRIFPVILAHLYFDLGAVLR